MRSLQLLRATVGIALVAATLVHIHSPEARAQAPLQPGVSYQGHLEKNDLAYDGAADFKFRLFDSVTAGSQIGGDLNFVGVNVDEGMFNVTLDFGANAFAGDARWIEIAAKTIGDANFITLTPRQPVQPAPYAVYALQGPGGTGPWTTGGSGIEYLGNVGIGVAANPAMRLRVDSGTANSNTLAVTNDNPNWAALTIANTATNGWGLYDNLSDRHYFGGQVGIGTDAPLGKLHVDSYSGSAVIGRHLSNWVGVYGESQTSVGVWGASNTGIGVQGETTGAQTAGVYGLNTNASGYGGIFRNTGGGAALWADGLAYVKTLQILGGADIVEGFDTGEQAIEPGTVVVIDEQHPGELRASSRAYDSRVAGVVSGAGGISPGLRLGQEGVMDGETPVAMSGRVYVRCSAENGPIQPGDLLTTAMTAGHAMRASNSDRSHGAVLGKAMNSLDSGTGLVLVLVNLQ